MKIQRYDCRDYMESILGYPDGDYVKYEDLMDIIKFTWWSAYNYALEQFDNPNGLHGLGTEKVQFETFLKDLGL